MRPETVLPAALLERIRGRAAGYDRDNAFFHEDLEELAAAGYLKIFVPVSDGGLGLGLSAAAQLQRRLATAAPATALAVNMHLVWTGVAHVLAGTAGERPDEDLAVDRRADLERAVPVALPASDEVAVVLPEPGPGPLHAGLVERVELLVVGAQGCIGDLQAGLGLGGHVRAPSWMGRAPGGRRRDRKRTKRAAAAAGEGSCV